MLAFADLIERKYVSTRTAYRPFDLARKAQYFALDVTTELSFGAPFGDLPSDSDVYGYIATTEQTLRYIILTTELPWLVRLLQSPLVKRFLPSDRDLLGIGRAMGWVLSSPVAQVRRLKANGVLRLLESQRLPSPSASAPTRKSSTTCSAPLSSTVCRRSKQKPKLWSKCNRPSFLHSPKPATPPHPY